MSTTDSPPFMTLTFATPTAALAAQAATSAVIAGFPLLEALRTGRVQTAGLGSDAVATYGRAPFNQLGHSAERWTDRNRDIVTPANDLLYSNAWLDLRNGPVLLHLPPHTGRYFVLELMDVYTNNFQNIGPRNSPAAGGRFALVGPGRSTAQVPQGCTPISCPTDLVWLLGRVLVDDDADLPAARAFQAGFSTEGPATSTLPDSLAQWQEGGDTAIDFVANLLRAVREFPPPASQAGVFALLTSVHARLDDGGRLADLRPGVVEGLRQGHAAAMSLIEAFGRSPSKAAWRYSTRLGRYGDDLMLRAATAFKGLGALAGDEAIYATTDDDSDGLPLTGEHVYRLHFVDGGDLPADAFWSITLYGADRYLSHNDLGRHALGNRSRLHRDAQGGLTLQFSHRPPDGPVDNWLPAPQGPFYLILRLYHPQARLASYRFPNVERVS